MPQSIDKRSFAYGILSAVLLASVAGAAANFANNGPDYTATPVAAGLGLQITAHGTNKLYSYSRKKKDGNMSYELVEIVDLSVTGRQTLDVESIDKAE